MIQPTRVLPSNAPPLPDGDGVHQASRILQEHSGNRQQHVYPALTDYDDHKYATTVTTENTWPNTQPQYAVQLHHPQPIHRQAWTYGQARQTYAQDHENEQVILAKARHLYRRFRNSEPYLKYRSRQQKDDKAGQEQKWPDHLEEAFFRALVKYPPMGRRKHLHKDKQRGRNELIADHIEELTGESRSRKQVSSHIQVLKPFVENDKQIMRYLSKDDMGGGLPGGRHYGDHPGSEYMSGRRASTYPAVAPAAMTRDVIPTRSHTELSTIRGLKHNLEIFEPTTFSMFVQRIQRKHQLVNGEWQDECQRLHTYTESIEHPLVVPDIQISDWISFQQDYPLLASVHSQRPLDCNVVVADASLAFPTDNFKDENGNSLEGIELGISFVCSSRHLSPAATVHCRNSFYRNGRLVDDHSSSFPVPLQMADDKSSVTTSIKFGSNFWASILAQLASRLKRPAEADKDPQDDVRKMITGITAMQEVIVVTPHGQERILVMFWTFRQSSATRGRASWRRLVLPSATQYPEPPKPERVDSMYEDFGGQVADLGVSTSQVQQSHSQPALQSPFEYDSGSSSTFSSTAWTASFSEGSSAGQANNNAAGVFVDNDFDFNGGSINMAFDPTLDFNNFDSSAFNFDAAMTDFAQDPALEQYSQTWTDNYTGFEGDAPLSALTADSNYAPSTQMEEATQNYQQYNVPQDPSMQPHEQQTYGQSYEHQLYTVSHAHEQQAYGGAGHDKINEDALSTLADASYIARSLMPKAGIDQI